MVDEKLLLKIADRVPALVIMYNVLTGEYLYVNKSVEKILGYKAEEFTKGGIAFVSSLVHPEDLPKILKENAEAIKKANIRSFAKNTDPIISFEYRVKHKDGSWKWLQTDGTVFARNTSGHVELLINVSIDITEYKKKSDEIAEKLRYSEDRWRFLAESGPQKVFTAKPNGEMDYFSPQWTEYTGLTSDQMKGWGWTQIIHPDDVEANIKLWKQSVEKNVPFQFEHRIARADSSYCWHIVRAVPILNEHKKVILWVGSDTEIDEQKKLYNLAKQEIDERKETEEKLRQSEERFRDLVQAVEDYAIFALDPDGYIVSWNEGVENILGYKKDEVLGLHLREFFTQQDRDLGIPEKELERVNTLGTSIHEGLRVRKDGSTFHAIGTTAAIRDENGNIKGYSKIMRDVTEKKEAEETIRYQAYHDPLTGLANRKALEEQFNSVQSNAAKNEGKAAVMFLDLDRFKNINDTLGHTVGDLILKEVADRLVHTVRQGDMVARLGGDEFIILLDNIKGVDEISEVCNKILKSFEPVMRVVNQSLHISASFGVAVFPNDGADINLLLKNADTALYRAKDKGRNRYQFYNHNMNLQSVARLSLEQELRSAVNKNQLKIAYQPFIDIRSGKVVGVEALVRWHHPEHGILHPAQFISLAEETGIIIPMGKWILETVCMQGKRWCENGLPLQVTVNLSAHQFAEPKIVQTVTEALSTSGLDGRFLELEITESVAMENIARTSTKLFDLKEQGISIAIDDFGTGYSSLSYLERFPVHKLKIDKSFVKHSLVSQQDTAIIRAVISMGKSLGLKICAEGIEEKEQLELLASLDCDIAQGFYICKPIYADEFYYWHKRKQLINS